MIGAAAGGLELGAGRPRSAVTVYREKIATHECTGEGEDCPVPAGFYILSYVDGDESIVTMGGGHGASPELMVEAMIGMIDKLVMDSSDLPAMFAFAKSRDLIHTAADQIAPSGDAAAEFSAFAAGLDDE